MMEDADDQDFIIFHPIENAMFPMCEAAIGLALSCRSRACLRMIPQQHKRLVKAAHIGFRRVLAKMRKAIIVYLAQVRDGRIGKLNFSHALPAVWR